LLASRYRATRIVHDILLPTLAATMG
jgi:hypothetical protein